MELTNSKPMKRISLSLVGKVLDHCILYDDRICFILLDGTEITVEIKNNISVVFDESYFHDNLKIRDIDKIMKNIYSNWDKNKFFQYLAC